LECLSKILIMIKKSILFSGIILLFVSGCNVYVNTPVKSPVDKNFGYAECTLIDKTKRFTIIISDSIDGASKNYGFLGRDVLMAPMGYKKTRQIPLAEGQHNIKFKIDGTDKNIKLEFNVEKSRITPLILIIEKLQVDGYHKSDDTGYNITGSVGTIKDLTK
jgi:hypothetical protein